jgi:flagellar basal body rod protein FlgB
MSNLSSYLPNQSIRPGPELYRPEKNPVKSNGNDVHLENEVGEMVKNTLRHKALIRLLTRKYKQIELALGFNS